MKILFVASYNKNSFAPFVVEQAEALKGTGCEMAFLGLQGKGVKGYLKNWPDLKRKLRDYQPDVIHAHYGLSGLLANLQRKVPVVTTYHGSDINDKRALPFSKMAIRLSAWNIFVSRKTLEKIQPRRNFSLIPCGIDLYDLQQTEKAEARQRMGMSMTKRYVLFAGGFDNSVKNVGLAREAMALLHDEHAELLELKGYTRDEVTLLMCAVDALLLTSYSEGSPQVIKEAMACGCPIVSVNVGDVKERTERVEGCFVAKTHQPKELAELLGEALLYEGKTKGKEKLFADGLDNRQVAQRLLAVYENVLK